MAGFDTGRENLESAPVVWAVEVNGIECGRRQFTLRFLPPRPLPEAPGRFTVGLYVMGEVMVYSTPELRRKVADLYLASGIRRKGLYYDNEGSRRGFDDYLRRRGFTMNEIGLLLDSSMHRRILCAARRDETRTLQTKVPESDLLMCEE